MDYQTPAPYATALEFTRAPGPRRSYKNDNRKARADLRRDVRTFKRTANFMLDMIEIGVTTLDRAAGIRGDAHGKPEGVCSIMNYVLEGNLYGFGNGNMLGYTLCRLFMSRDLYIDGLGENNVVTPQRVAVLTRIANTPVKDIIEAHRKHTYSHGVDRFGALA